MAAPDETESQPRSPAMAFGLLKDAIQGHSPVSILCQLTTRFLFVRRDEFHEESSEIHRHHAYIEFLSGLLASRPFPTGELKGLTVSHCDAIWRRLQDYDLAVKRALLVEAPERSGRLHELEFEAKNYSLTVRGEAYPHQLEQMAVGLYAEHDAWFQRTLGFTIREALHAVRAAMNLSAWCRHQVLSAANRADEDPTTRT